MAFDSGVPFPLELAALTPKTTWSNTVAIMGGGSEQRNQNWNDARRRYDASTAATLTLVSLHLVEKHFNARRGRTRSFALRDRSSFRATTEPLGTAGGIGSTMQLQVAGGDSGNAYNREVYLPESGTVRIFANAVEKTETTHWTMAYTGATAGTLTWVASFAGQSITATFDYWSCVRYDLDEFPDSELFVWTTGTTGLVRGPSLPLIETRYPDEF